ncbi:hypothetical protein VZT92_023834 [Zoarces viviparus]|uniref:Uncharacterized protein n=1 Tax=Zoarces viviparus TaxID=48416 RepID=A0AAW1E8Q9_ZOAVI
MERLVKRIAPEEEEDFSGHDSEALRQSELHSLQPQSDGSDECLNMEGVLFKRNSSRACPRNTDLTRDKESRAIKSAPVREEEPRLFVLNLQLFCFLSAFMSIDECAALFA